MWFKVPLFFNGKERYVSIYISSGGPQLQITPMIPLLSHFCRSFHSFWPWEPCLSDWVLWLCLSKWVLSALCYHTIRNYKAIMWELTRPLDQPFLHSLFKMTQFCYQSPNSLHSATWCFPVTAGTNAMTAIPAYPAPFWPQPDMWHYISSLPGGMDGGDDCDLFVFCILLF